MSVTIPKFSFSKRTAFEALLVAAIVGLGVFSWLLYSEKQDLKTELANVTANPQIAVQQQTTELINAVREVYPTLPTDETPTIAEVSDAAKAKKQSKFFDNAQNGDKVLMYVKSGTAILYRPETKQLILVAPLTFSDTSKKTTETQQTEN